MNTKAKIVFYSFVVILLSIVIGLNIDNIYVLLPTIAIYIPIAVKLTNSIIELIKPD